MFVCSANSPHKCVLYSPVSGNGCLKEERHRDLLTQFPQSRVLFSISIVMAYNQVKNDCKVFKLVENDDLVGLMKHLALGKAYTRDCDEDGRSLLHVSVFQIAFGRE